MQLENTLNSPTSLRLHWYAPSNTGTTKLSAYTLSIVGGSTNATRNYSTGSSGYSVTTNGLTANTNYTYTMTATNTLGLSNSTTATFRTGSSNTVTSAISPRASTFDTGLEPDLTLAAPVPSATPTVEPTIAPTVVPTVVPSAVPTVAPSATPTTEPSASPTVTPTLTPTAVPTVTPSTPVNPAPLPITTTNIEPSAAQVTLPVTPIFTPQPEPATIVVKNPTTSTTPSVSPGSNSVTQVVTLDAGPRPRSSAPTWAPKAAAKVSAKSITLSWQKALPKSGIISKYTVKVMQGKKIVQTRSFSAKTTTVVVKKLQSHTKYTFLLSARNSFGLSITKQYSFKTR